MFNKAQEMRKNCMKAGQKKKREGEKKRKRHCKNMKPLEAAKTKQRRTANRKPSLMIKPTNRTRQTIVKEKQNKKKIMKK